MATWKNGRYSVETKVLLRVGACTLACHFVLLWNSVFHIKRGTCSVWEPGAKENIHLEMNGGLISSYIWFSNSLSINIYPNILIFRTYWTSWKKIKECYIKCMWQHYIYKYWLMPRSCTRPHKWLSLVHVVGASSNLITSFCLFKICAFFGILLVYALESVAIPSYNLVCLL